MEKLVSMFRQVYKGKRILVTGHTGFKGSWLSLWLSSLGAEVIGISLPPTTDTNHWDLLNLDVESYFIDIRDENAFGDKVHIINPDRIFHLAA